MIRFLLVLSLIVLAVMKNYKFLSGDSSVNSTPLQDDDEFTGYKGKPLYHRVKANAQGKTAPGFVLNGHYIPAKKILTAKKMLKGNRFFKEAFSYLDTFDKPLKAK